VAYNTRHAWWHLGLSIDLWVDEMASFHDNHRDIDAINLPYLV
jgi:hypothetical protein